MDLGRRVFVVWLVLLVSIFFSGPLMSMKISSFMNDIGQSSLDESMIYGVSIKDDFEALDRELVIERLKENINITILAELRDLLDKFSPQISWFIVLKSSKDLEEVKLQKFIHRVAQFKRLYAFKHDEMGCLQRFSSTLHLLKQIDPVFCSRLLNSKEFEFLLYCLDERMSVVLKLKFHK